MRAHSRNFNNGERVQNAAISNVDVPDGEDSRGKVWPSFVTLGILCTFLTILFLPCYNVFWIELMRSYT